jgi:hypothetical protein
MRCRYNRFKMGVKMKLLPMVIFVLIIVIGLTAVVFMDDWNTTSKNLLISVFGISALIAGLAAIK